jgi:hypothetical protein
MLYARSAYHGAAYLRHHGAKSPGVCCGRNDTAHWKSRWTTAGFEGLQEIEAARGGFAKFGKFCFHFPKNR